MRKVPNSIASIEDLRRRAHAPRAQALHGLYGGGLVRSRSRSRENRRDLDAIRFRERVMFDVSIRKLETTMLGEKVAMPLAIGPTGHVRRDLGERRDAVRAAPRTISAFPSRCRRTRYCSIEDVAESVDRPFWFQLYLKRTAAYRRS